MRLELQKLVGDQWNSIFVPRLVSGLSMEGLEGSATWVISLAGWTIGMASTVETYSYATQ